MALTLNHLFAVIMLSGAFSLVSAMLFVVMDAVDVAFTEAAVGAGVSTVLMLSTMALTVRIQKETNKSMLLPIVVVCMVGVLLIYGTLDMPNFGAFDSPAQLHLGSKYLDITYKDMGIPNVVTGILASYRGYDTLGETVVVLTAGLGVILLLSGLKGRKNKSKTMKHHLILKVITKFMVGYRFVRAICAVSRRLLSGGASKRV